MMIMQWRWCFPLIFYIAWFYWLEYSCRVHWRRCFSCWKRTELPRESHGKTWKRYWHVLCTASPINTEKNSSWKKTKKQQQQNGVFWRLRNSPMTIIQHKVCRLSPHTPTSPHTPPSKRKEKKKREKKAAVKKQQQQQQKRGLFWRLRNSPMTMRHKVCRLLPHLPTHPPLSPISW